jgi:hypothetical protein
VRRLAKRTKRCLMDPRGRKRAFPPPPGARRSALVFRPREIANMSCRRSRTDDGAAMSSVYQIKLSGAAPRAESQARQKRAAQHNGLESNTGSDRLF